MEDDPDDEQDWDNENSQSDQKGPRLGHGVPRFNELDYPFITVVDSSGIHHLPLITCNCRGSGHTVEDALTAGLLSSSFNEIQTVFTTACLDDFRVANLECKTSAYQYFQRLRRLTNPANPLSVPDRYVELRRASREWRHLKKMKQNGFGCNRSTPGVTDLSLYCPACPQPNVNLPADWENTPEP